MYICTRKEFILKTRMTSSCQSESNRNRYAKTKETGLMGWVAPTCAVLPFVSCS